MLKKRKNFQSGKMCNFEQKRINRINKMNNIFILSAEYAATITMQYI